jgi:hypothetical protein
MRDFDYYIFIDYSENLRDYSIIDNDGMMELLPVPLQFLHGVYDAHVWREDENVVVL